MQGLKWDDARVLLALARAGTLSRAGRALGVDASTISRRLDALEAALGARLFDRTPDGLAPLPLAGELVPHAEAMERAATGLVLAARGTETEVEGEVVVGAPPGYAEHLLAPALPRLLERHPGLRITIDARPQTLDLARHEADLALRLARPHTGDLVAAKLGTIDVGLLASPGYARELGTIERWSDARFVGWGSDAVQIAFARFLADHVPDRAIVFRSNAFGVQIAAAEAGVGAVLADANLVRVRRLVEVDLAPPLRRELAAGSGALWLVAHRALRDVPRVAAVWSFLRAEAASIVARPPDQA